MVSSRSLLERFSQFIDPEVEEIARIATYLIQSGGKALRPTLLLMTCEGFGYDPSLAIELAAGIEFIHVASLLHDDVVDGASLRRGKKSANLVFGNQSCVLAGDYLYAKALELYANFGNIKAIEILSKAVMKMSQGQLLELRSIGKILTKDEYFRIIDLKTGALIASSLQIGALIANQEKHELIYKAGIHVGRAFQIVDDVLDYEGSESKFGKKVGSDIKEGKCTLPLICAEGALEDFSFPVKDPESLRLKVIELGGTKLARSIAREELLKALDLLSEFKELENLIRFLEGIVEREN
ncbi:MAG: polyprenyl synthetase family protein [Aquificaceae bacterium]